MFFITHIGLNRTCAYSQGRMYLCNADEARLLCWQPKPYNLSIMLMHLSERLASAALDKHQ